MPEDDRIYNPQLRKAEQGAREDLKPNDAHKEVVWKTVVGVVLLTVTIFLLWFFFFNPTGENIVQNLRILSLDNDTVTLSTDKTSNISGMLLMSLLPKDRSTESIALQKQYAYNFDTNTLAKMPTNALFPNVPESDLHMMYYDFSPDSSWATFVAFSKDEYEKNDGLVGALQVYRARIEGGTYTNVEKLTDRRILSTRTPNISNNGEVLYSAMSADADLSNGLASVVAEDWDVHFVNKNGEDTTMGGGLYPKWFTDDAYLVLKNDGIHWVSITNDSDYLVAGKTGAQTNTMMDVSDNGLFVVLTIPDENMLQAYQVTGEIGVGRPVLTPIGSVSATGFWPILSPDGRFVAFQLIDSYTQDTNPNPRVVIFETSSLTPAPSLIDLNDFEQQNMFITDWR